MVRRLMKALAGRRTRASGAPDGKHGELKLRFKEFRYLLRANNEVLGIIAEIQTRLDGGGQVGLDFLRDRYIAASSKVFKMMRHLNAIAGGRYVALAAPFDAIRAQIDDILTRAAGPGGGSLILPLVAVQADMEHLAGAKAANLAALARLGVNTPPALVVTTEAYRRFMEHSSLGRELREQEMLLEDDASYAELSALSRRLAARVQAAPLPPELADELQKSAVELSRAHGDARLSCRSSALGEDGGASFAGLYASVLGVNPAEAVAAWRRVVASLFSPAALAYRHRQGLRHTDAEMAVLMQVMLEPASSGVMYTTDPLGGGQGPLVISAVHGLGLGLVDGSLDPDTYRVSRGEPPRLMETAPGRRTSRLMLGPEGPRMEEMSPETVGTPCLTAARAEELAGRGLRLEAYFGCPQDVEWAQDADGELFILQSRPLAVWERLAPVALMSAPQAPVILRGGASARPGAACGPAHLVLEPGDLADFPDGGVLVARHSSPGLAAVLSRAAAVVTEVGGVAGHLAALAREFGVPALVGARGALKAIGHDQLVTVDASAGVIYAGRVDRLLDLAGAASVCRPLTRPRPAWYAAADLVTRLTLTDPKSSEFRPQGCRTLHDLIRFMHEKSFGEMFQLGQAAGDKAGGQARRLAARLPFELWVLDLEDGIRPGAGGELSMEDIQSRPGRALLTGLTDPAVPWGRPRPVSFKGLASVMSGALLNPPDDGKERAMGQRAYLIVGSDYVNFNCRVGYHFTALDSFCGPNPADNYISFRFAGGAATSDRRDLRAELVRGITGSLGFASERSGDAVNAFLKKYDEPAILELLAELGRLVLFTRQMDMLMDGPRMVQWLARAFLEKNYDLVPDRSGRENAS